jgi:hypothetical protein
MTAGAMLGATKFYCIGTLSLDEVFSPVELILDALRISQIRQIVSGFKLEEFGTADGLAEDLTEEMRTYLEEGFIISDRTLERHKNYINYSPFINRHQYKIYVEKHNTEMLQEAEKTVCELSREESPAVSTPEQCSALRELYHAAELQTIG